MSASEAVQRLLGPGHLLWTPAPGVSALSTLRRGGVSQGHWGGSDGAPVGLNLGTHVGDAPAHVAANRARLQQAIGLPILWMTQVHGVDVFDADVDPQAPAHPEPKPEHATEANATEGAEVSGTPRADAAVSTQSGRALCIMTADCLPVLLADGQGRCIGAAHAGWRGLQAGVIEATVQAMRRRLPSGASLRAWLGPAIGPRAFEVGEEVREAFVHHDPRASIAFVPTGRPGKWWADLFLLGRQRLADCGVTSVSGPPCCTVEDPDRFYSHRRDRITGRMASLIWIHR